MSNFPIIFLILAAVVLVFGFGGVLNAQRAHSEEAAGDGSAEAAFGITGEDGPGHAPSCDTACRVRKPVEHANGRIRIIRLLRMRPGLPSR